MTELKWRTMDTAPRSGQFIVVMPQDDTTPIVVRWTDEGWLEEQHFRVTQDRHHKSWSPIP